MKIALLFGFLFALIPFFASAQPAEISIIPQPTSIEYGVGTFRLSRSGEIAASGKSAKAIADLLNSRLASAYGFQLAVKQKPHSSSAIFISSDFPKDLPAGSYRLQIDANGVHLSGTPEGLFYGVQTLMQILPNEFAEAAELPFVAIADRPRFRYRGMHLDTARHFMPVEFIRKYIDLMAQYKFNYFHWHLTDDQGWRIEIKKYPLLTRVGSMRPETVKERNLTPYIGDGQPHGGFYTQKEIREIVRYARQRFITVIPEIEMPGHASAALAAYPQFGCKKDFQYKVQTTWGIFKEVFCPTDETFLFLENVLDEVIGLFPDSPYVHIGGDEVLKDHWKESEFVRQLKQRENLKDEHEVQSYFIRRIERFLNSRGKRMIGWDEILEGGLAPNATVMSWRGMRGGIEAAKSGHDVIMTPTDYVYFDYGQGDPAYEPLNIGGYVPLEKVYGFDPIPQELTAQEAKYVIGGQANVWTEYMKTPEKVEYMAFPRMLALSEVLWSQKENRDFSDFRQRLFAHLPRLDKQKVNYRIPEPVGLQNVVTANENVKIELMPAPGTSVYYTTDGAAPDENSPRYTKPIELTLTDGEVKTLKTIVANAAGRKSSVYAAAIYRGKLLEPVSAAETRPGVSVTILTGFEGGSLVEESKSILLGQFEKRSDLPRPFDVIFSGYFSAPVDGLYEFQIETAGTASFRIGDEKKLIARGNGKLSQFSTLIPLKQGLHPVQISYYRYIGPNDSFRLRWGIKGQGLRQAYGGEFRH